MVVRSILDINVPGMGGLDFLRLPPVRDAALPIVAISGVATESQAHECLRLAPGTSSASR